MLLRFCPECGAGIGAVAPVVCRACGAEHWRNAKPCAGGLVTRDGRLLLVRRAFEPWRGSWDIPGGFCDADEHPEDAVVREVREEVGLTVAVRGLVGIWMDTYGPPGPTVAVTLNCYYHVVPTTDDDPVVDPAESTEAAWFSPTAIPDDLAFPNHAGQVIDAWRRSVSSGVARSAS